MKIKFVIDPEYDIKIGYQMSRLFGKKPIPSQEEHAKQAKEAYATLLPYIKKAKQQYQKSWNEIIEEFSKVVADLTHTWFYDEYICVVGQLNQGISNWNGNKIIRWWQENPDTQRRITAHELLLAHYFSIHRRLFSNSSLIDKQIWALGEIAAFALTGLEPKLTKFWPWDFSGYYTNHNYPQLVSLQNQLKEPFLERKSFTQYIKTGIDLVKKYPSISYF